MAKSKKVKAVKKYSKFGIAKFLVTALILGGGLIYGTQVVQKSQENRSRATCGNKADEYGGGTKEECSKIGGKCGDFLVAHKDGACCEVGSVVGVIYSGRCGGQSRVKCCAPSSSSIQPTPTTKKSYTAKEYKLGTNKKCSSLGGKCGDFDEVPPGGVSCTVDSITGIINKGKCDGDSTVQCCASKKNTPTSTPTLTPTPTKIPTTKTKVNGVCSKNKNMCDKGFFKDIDDSVKYYQWRCLGLYGGSNANCTKKK